MKFQPDWPSMTWAELADRAVHPASYAEGGNGPVGAEIEAQRRVVVALEDMRTETGSASQRLERLTRWLIALTVALVVVGVASIVTSITV